MKPYAMAVIKHFEQVKVVHHLPGRLRLYIPLLERLGSQLRRYQPDLIDIVILKEGIDDVEVSILSGRVLVHYDPDRTGKSQILHWFRNLALAFCEGYAREPFVSERQILPFLKKMRVHYMLRLKEDDHAEEGHQDVFQNS